MSTTVLDFESAVSWRFLTVDILTGVVRGELTPLSISWKRKRNKPSGMSMSLPLATVQPADVDPWRSVIYVERDGVIVNDGIVTAARAKGSNRVVDVVCSGLLEYLNRRVIREHVTYSNVPQAEIAADLINSHTTYAGINMPAVVVGQNSVLRDRTYQPWDRYTVGKLVDDLSNVINGLDVEVTLTPTGPNKWDRKVLVSDQLGRHTGITLIAGVNLSSYGVEQDGQHLANRVGAIGEGEEDAMLIAESSSSNRFGRPLLDDIVPYKSVSRMTTLQEHADGDLEDRKEPLYLPSLTLTNPHDPVPGSWRAGDTVTVRIDDYWMQFDGRARILGWDHSLNRDSGESITFDVEDARDPDAIQ